MSSFSEKSVDAAARDLRRSWAGSDVDKGIDTTWERLDPRYKAYWVRWAKSMMMAIESAGYRIDREYPAWYTVTGAGVPTEVFRAFIKEMADKPDILSIHYDTTGCRIAVRFGTSIPETWGSGTQILTITKERQWGE